MANITYKTKHGLYVNLTYRCDSNCVFCHRADYPIVGEYDLKLSYDEEPSVEEIVQSVTENLPCEELVYCGYGEPMLRYETLIESARLLRPKVPAIRINTNGHGNLIVGRDLIPEMAGVIDSLSVSLNAPTQEEYDRLCPNTFGKRAYPAVLEFIQSAVKAGIKVTATAVAYPGVDGAACEKTACALGADFRLRPLDDVIVNFSAPPLNP